MKCLQSNKKHLIENVCVSMDDLHAESRKHHNTGVGRMGVILLGLGRDFPPVFLWDWDGTGFLLLLLLLLFYFPVHNTAQHREDRAYLDNK